MNAFVFSLNAVLPLILLVFLGYILRRSGRISPQFMKEGNKFCFRYGFTAMVFTSVYRIDSIASVNWMMILYAAGVILLLFAVGLAYVHFFISDQKQKGVVHQAFYRSCYATVGLPLVYNLYGDDGMSNAALLVAFLVPLYNLLGVVSLSLFTGKNEEHPVKSVLMQIVKNPLIQGAAAALVCVAVRPYCGTWRFSTGNLKFIYKALNMLGEATPAFALVFLGGQFAFSSSRRYIPQLRVSILVRLVLAPIVGMSAVLLLPRLFNQTPFGPAELAALLPLFGNMEAIASVAMADQMGSNSELAAQILVWTAIFSSFTMFAFIALFRAAGIF